MAEFKILQGILTLVDIVNFTGQATKLGEGYTAQYSEYFQDKIKSMVEKHGFAVVKSLGDAVLVFGTEPESILDFMRDLFLNDKPEDKFGFVSRFRMVAHSGYFQFKMENNRPVDLVSPEGIKVFRLEKHARSWELVVTHSLFQGIKPLVTGKQMEAHRMVLKESLKGFDNEEWFPPFYRLRLVPELAGVTDLLELRMKELEQEVQFIPVFGSIYQSVPMEKNFINLSMKWKGELTDTACPPGLEEDDDERHGEKMRRGAHGSKDEWLYHELERKSLDRVRELDVPMLYEKHCKGIIFGLPGAGKTTILKHLAFREFNAAETAKDGEKRLVLFVPCRGIPFYDEWYIKRYGEDRPGEPDRDSALEYMTWVFLFGGRSNYDLTPEEWVQFQDAGKRVKQAFEKDRLTLLVDALDEAPDGDTKDSIRVLFTVLAAESNGGNRLFLTSRPSERIHLKQEETTVFYVRDLTMDQVRAVAKNLLTEESTIYKKFDEAIWREEVVAKMAATPITALLVTAYFQAYEKFQHRFPMYDLLVKFILLRVWESIKTGKFSFKNMNVFFKEIKKPDFLERNPETRLFYDALGSLCFDLFYDNVDGRIQRTINEETLMTYFTRFIDEHMRYDRGEKDEAAVNADRWIERFHGDHLLLQAGKTDYVFVHSTVMEYLAAYHLVRLSRQDKARVPVLVRRCMGREDYLELETLPIAAGSDLLRGFAIFAALRDVKVEYDRRLLYEQAIKCLGELEWQLTKTLKPFQIDSLKKPVMDIVRAHRDTVDWIYTYLKGLITTEDKERLEEDIERLDISVKLSRPVFFDEYLEYEALDRGGGELVGLRKTLLEKLVQKELLDGWFAAHKPAEPAERLPAAEAPEKEIPGNVLQLDTDEYHPEDKHFTYYRKIVGRELAGFFGSPNLRHSGIVNACAFSPDGKTMVSASGDYTLKLWDVESGKEIRALNGHKGYVLSCAFSPDGARVISASEDKTLKLWEAGSGKEIRAFNGHNGRVLSCAFSPDGARVISASDDKTLKLWEAGSGKELKSLELPWRPYYVAFSPKHPGKVITANLNGTVTMFEFER